MKLRAHLISGLAAAAILASVLVQDASGSAFPGGNGRIAFSGFEGITIVNPDGSDPIVLTATHDVGGSEPDWSPDGTKLVFVGSVPTVFGEQVYVINADGTGMHALTSTGINQWPRWSPDGARIVFQRQYTKDPITGYTGLDVFTMNADGSDVTVLTDSGNVVPGHFELSLYAVDGPNWSPDGSTIVFTAFLSTPVGLACNLWTIPAGGGGWTQITPTDLSTIRGDGCYPDYTPSWSPDGSRIVFDRYSPLGHSIRVINSDGSGMTPMITDLNDLYPVWSPDGARIAFSRSQIHTVDIYTANPDGSDPQPVIGTSSGGPLAWQRLTPPTITSADTATFKVGVAGTFTITTTGSPNITETGALPAGVAFTNNGDGTATLAGTPDAATGGSYPLTITASNGVSPDAAQSFTLTVTDRVTPTITWPDPADIVYGAALGVGQLNASTGVPGTFVYSPPAGVVLGAGPAQALTVTFTPADPQAYTQASRIVHINVLTAPLTVTALGASKVVGASLPPLSATIAGLVNGDTPGSVGAPAVLTTTATPSSPVGAYPIVASGIASPNYTVMFVSGTLTIVPGTTTSALSASLSSAGLLQPIKLTAIVAVVPPAAGSPGGTVQFFDGAVLLGAASLSGTTATLTINGLASGAHTLTTVYAGDSQFATSTSPAVVVTVQSAAASTFTLVGAVNNPAAVGHSVTLAALVLPLGGGASPTGTVYFLDGATLVGSGALGAGIASMTTASLGVGPHLLSAYYAGNGTFAPSLSAPAAATIYAGTPPSLATVAISASPVPAPFGTTATLTATLTVSTGSPTGTVYFLADGALVGSGAVTNAAGVFRAQMTTATLSRGAHVISAVFVGSGPFGVSGSPPAVLAVP